MFPQVSWVADRYHNTLHNRSSYSFLQQHSSTHIQKTYHLLRDKLLLFLLKLCEHYSPPHHWKYILSFFLTIKVPDILWYVHSDVFLLDHHRPKKKSPWNKAPCQTQENEQNTSLIKLTWKCFTCRSVVVRSNVMTPVSKSSTNMWRNTLGWQCLSNWRRYI